MTLDIYQATVKEFIADEKGNVSKAIIVSLESKFDEATKRYIMVEVAGSENEVEADLVLIAAGFLGTQSYIADAFGLNLMAEPMLRLKLANTRPMLTKYL